MDAIRFIIREEIRLILKEEFQKNSLVPVHRCIDGDYKIEHSGIEFFAVNKEYAQGFGNNCYEFTINTSSAKILDLEKWNNLYTSKTGENGNIYNRVQGIFVIGGISIGSGYEKELEKFSQAFDEKTSQEFIDEFNSADAIYGEDAGYQGEFVFAVKNKETERALDFVKGFFYVS